MCRIATHLEHEIRCHGEVLLEGDLLQFSTEGASNNHLGNRRHETVIKYGWYNHICSRTAYK
jgi:hypothetical protein